MRGLLREKVNTMHLTLTELLRAIVLVALTYFLQKLARVRWSYKHLPKPPHSFLWGHLKLYGEIMAIFPPDTYPQVFYTELAKRYDMPGVWYLDLWPFGPAQVVVTDVEASVEMLSKKPYLIHKAVNLILGLMLGPNVIPAVNGPMWKSLHQMMGHSFSPVGVRAQIPTIVEHATVFHKKLRQAVEVGEPFSMADLTTRAVSDAISVMTLGFSLNAQHDGSPLLGDFKTLFTLTRPYAAAWNPIKKVKLWWKMRSARQRTDAYVHKELQAKYQQYRGNDAIPTRKTASSVLDRMVAQKIEESGDKAPYLDQAFVKLVTSNLKGLLAGGQGTTADALTYAYLLLSLHPEIVSRLRSEHASLFPLTLTGTTSQILSNPSLASSTSLPYTTAVLKETLRLFPPGFTPRTAPPGVTHLTYQGRSYPVAGQMVMPNLHATHYDPAHFPNPTQFLPDRFLEDYEPKAHRFAWRPFERGLRNCIGQQMAMEEMRMTLLLTVRWFDFEPILEGVKGKGQGVARFSDLDELVGDTAWQLWGLGATPRGGVWMRGVYKGEDGRE